MSELWLRQLCLLEDFFRRTVDLEHLVTDGASLEVDATKQVQSIDELPVHLLWPEGHLFCFFDALRLLSFSDTLDHSVHVNRDDLTP